MLVIGVGVVVCFSRVVGRVSCDSGVFSVKVCSVVL